ncbi:unnamed protein product [Hyaloperonospora brassicae]|uniref:Transposase Helix-turn-helix domain-containing protein n=1 Tax=Hyaloperonospora brassicae TaxID=162125 RepID=A0AAV0US24_HYABA|nr:unnamed protein product [Hyaloperonospora brassicae]
MDTLPAHWVWPPLDAPEERRDGTMTKRKFMALFELLFWFNLKVTSIADLIGLATSTVSIQVNTMPCSEEHQGGRTHQPGVEEACLQIRGCVQLFFAF